MKISRLNRGRTSIVFLLLASLLLLAACNGDNEEPTETPTSIAEEATDLPTEEPATEEPIVTEEPEATETAVPDPTATDEPEPTAEPTATMEPTVVPAPQFTEATCEFDVPSGREVTCGWLTVPEDHFDANNDNTIELHVAIFASDSDDPAEDPIIYLEGGPGGEALEAIPLAFEVRFASFLANHDLIMFDQRGTGYSIPSLACPNVTELSFELLDQDIPTDEASTLGQEALLACRDRLQEEGVNLAAFNSAQSAADLDTLRQALGYDQWNLWGISYGTRLAQTTMRDFPAGLRSVVLDSTYPLEANLLTDTPANMARAFDVFFAGCLADEACNEAYPELETVFYDTIDQLNEEKIIVPVTNFLTGDTYEAYFSGNDLLGVLFQSLYATEIIPELPKLIYDVNAGETSDLSTLLSSFLINSDFVSIGMQFSVQCNEENSFTNDAEVTTAIEAHPELAGFFDYSPNLGGRTLSICDIWGAGTADAVENEPVFSDIPTFVLAGEYDPITPPAWGELVASHLDNAYYHEFPGTGHGVTVSSDCAFDMMQAFLAEPTSAPDASCIADMTGPDFTVVGEGDSQITLVPFNSEMFGVALEGVVPEGWEEVQIGTYSRGNSGLDQTVIIQQFGTGVTPEQLLEVLAGQFGWESVPESSGSYEDANGRSWILYEAEVQGLLTNLAFVEENEGTLLLLLLSAPDEQPALYTDVFEPAMEALRVLE